MQISLALLSVSKQKVKVLTSLLLFVAFIFLLVIPEPTFFGVTFPKMRDAIVAISTFEFFSKTFGIIDRLFLKIYCYSKTVLS